MAPWVLVDFEIDKNRDRHLAWFRVRIWAWFRARCLGSEAKSNPKWDEIAEEHGLESVWDLNI